MNFTQHILPVSPVLKIFSRINLTTQLKLAINCVFSLVFTLFCHWHHSNQDTILVYESVVRKVSMELVMLGE